MYPILETKKLTANIYWMEVKAERIAKSCMPGQFVIVRTDADSERIPLTICDYNREKRNDYDCIPAGGKPAPI